MTRCLSVARCLLLLLLGSLMAVCSPATELLQPLAIRADVTQVDIHKALATAAYRRRRSVRQSSHLLVRLSF